MFSVWRNIIADAPQRGQSYVFGMAQHNRRCAWPVSAPIRGFLRLMQTGLCMGVWAVELTYPHTHAFELRARSALEYSFRQKRER